MKTYSVSVYNMAATRSRRSKYRKGAKWANIYVRASSPEKARESARRNNVHRDCPIIGQAREATPQELGAIPIAEAQKITADMREAWRQKHG